MSDPQPKHRPGAGDADSRWGEVSILALTELFLRHLRLLVGLPVLLAVLGAGFAVLNKDYQATSKFMPQNGGQGPSQIAGLAAQFGVELGIGGSQSAAFYEELFGSHAFLREVVESEYAFAVGATGRDTLRGNLIELFDIDADTPEQAMLAAVDELLSRISVATDQSSGVLTLHVTAPWPGLAEQINRRVLDLANEFNLNRRQSRAAEERRFIEGRLKEMQQELRAAEDELGRFLDQNRRGYTSSPHLQFEAARLERRVDLAHSVYMSLAQALEKARIEEVRNTPVITIVAGPEGFARSAGVNPVVFGFLGLVLGGMIALAVVATREFLAWQRATNRDRYNELRAQARSAVRELNPLRWRRKQ